MNWKKKIKNAAIFALWPSIGVVVGGIVIPKLFLSESFQRPFSFFSWMTGVYFLMGYVGAFVVALLIELLKEDKEKDKQREK